MRLNSALGLCLFGLALGAQPAQAAIIGPFPDFVGTVTASASVTINTRFAATIPIPFDGTFRINIRDRISASVSVTIPLYAASYLVVASTSTQPFNPNTDNITITDVYALNTNPTGDPNTPSLTGFNAANPQFTPLGPEQFIGNSGTVYTGTGMTTTLANLATVLPGYNLSAFSGDPTSIVYVEQTTLPAIDAAVPEPGSLTLLGAGMVGLVGYEWKRARKRAA